MNTAYTAGYGGQSLPNLARIAAEMEAMVLDIRLSAASYNPQWRKAAMQAALGARYVHLPALGNRNYKTGGPIRLDDPDRGLRFARKMLALGPVILLCGCRSATECHRSTVAQLLAAEGVPTRELVWTRPPRRENPEPKNLKLVP
jgi:uncharacterized protein (DUF736 family)